MSTVRTWEPFPKQKKFLGLDFKIREALFGGAVDSGKTETADNASSCIWMAQASCTCRYFI
jgi:hypothetical protein